MPGFQYIVFDSNKSEMPSTTQLSGPFKNFAKTFISNQTKSARTKFKAYMVDFRHKCFKRAGLELVTLQFE